jgi:hypothetical protein
VDNSGNPRLLLPAVPVVVDPGPCSLAEQLASTVNSARELNTTLGMRPYRVLSVRLRWNGNQAGRGDVTRVWEREFLPRPKVEPKVQRQLRDGGYVERGVVVLTELNPQLTEDEILDLFHRRPLPPNEEGFIEVFVDARDGKTDRRPFVVEDMPVRRPEQFDWKVTLTELAQGRDRSGAVMYPGQR